MMNLKKIIGSILWRRGLGGFGEGTLASPVVANRTIRWRWGRASFASVTHHPIRWRWG